MTIKKIDKAREIRLSWNPQYYSGRMKKYYHQGKGKAYHKAYYAYNAEVKKFMRLYDAYHGIDQKPEIS